MKYFRIYAAPDGESHFEDVEVPLAAGGGQSQLSDAFPATGIIFRTSAADQYIDWHHAPRRQFVITLAGEAEVEASDGEVRRIGPGTVMLAGSPTQMAWLLPTVTTAPPGGAGWLRVTVTVALWPAKSSVGSAVTAGSTSVPVA